MATNQPDAPYGWELATDANGNQKLVPAKTPPTSGKSFYDDVTGLAEETLMPRWSDFNNVRQNAWNAGAGMASQGYNEMQASSSPEGHWGSAAKMIAGAGQATLSPLAGAYYALIGAPAGRIGPGFEHAADVASLFTPGDLVALAKARAATALPASMAEHAGPANTKISSAASQSVPDRIDAEIAALEARISDVPGYGQSGYDPSKIAEIDAEIAALEARINEYKKGGYPLSSDVPDYAQSGYDPSTSGPSPYGYLISPAGSAALAKARAATALPAGMAEHAGAAGIPAKAPLASTKISGQAPGVSQVGTAELPRVANANVEGATVPPNTNVEGATVPANTNISSAASQAKVDQVAREAVADESATRDATSRTNYLTPSLITGQAVTATPATATPVDHAVTVAGQASQQFSQIPGGPLAMFAQPHSGAQYQPMSASSRSWTDPHMPQPSNPMPWGDSAPAGHLNTTPTVSIPTATARATAPAAAAPTAPAAAAPTAPAQSSPGFFSGLFKDPYAGMSPKQMNEAAQRMQSAGDEYGANLLTQRVDNAITSPDGSFAQGGSVDENHPVVQRAMHLVRSFLLNG